MEENIDFNVSLSDILTILGNTKRPLIEGEAVLNAKHVLIWGVKKMSGACFELFRAFLQSSHIRENPHEINIIITLDDGAKTYKYLCTCPAEEGDQCKHIFATLLYNNRNGFDNLEFLNCTDLKQKWGKLTSKVLEQYDEAVKIKDLCHYEEVKIKNKDHHKLRTFVRDFKNVEKF